MRYPESMNARSRESLVPASANEIENGNEYTGRRWSTSMSPDDGGNLVADGQRVEPKTDAAREDLGIVGDLPHGFKTQPLVADRLAGILRCTTETTDCRGSETT